MSEHYVPFVLVLGFLVGLIAVLVYKQKGPQGTEGLGLQGPPGPQGPVGSVIGVTGPQGQRGFGGSPGPTGATGPTGNKGNQGDRAIFASVNVAVTGPTGPATGTVVPAPSGTNAYDLSLVIPSQYPFVVGTVQAQNVPNGNNASVTVNQATGPSGPSGPFNFSFQIPAGPQGTTGLNGQNGPSGAAAFVPAGAIMMTGSASAPATWVLCNGTTYGITDPLYANLFSAIGTLYNTSTTPTGQFSVPNFAYRFPVGAAVAPPPTPDTFNYNLGQSGGNQSITLQTTNLPAHAHALPNLIQYSSAGYGWGDNGNWSGGGVSTTDNTGGGEAFNATPLFCSVNFIIKL